MKTLVEVGETDDPGFVAVLNSLLEELTSLHKPEVLWIIQIDNWFDHKWLKFSGTGGIAFGNYDSVKVEFYQDKLTFPPSPLRESWPSGLTSELAMTTEKHRCPQCRIVQGDKAAR